MERRGQALFGICGEHTDVPLVYPVPDVTVLSGSGLGNCSSEIKLVGV